MRAQLTWVRGGRGWRLRPGSRRESYVSAAAVVSDLGLSPRETAPRND